MCIAVRACVCRDVTDRHFFGFPDEDVTQLLGRITRFFLWKQLDAKRFPSLKTKLIRYFNMSTPARRRLMRDFKRLQEDPPAGVSGAPTDNNIMIWNAVIFGPHDTPFEDGTFKLTLEFTEEYPNKPPTVRFVSKMFHPNVYADGSICLDILQNRWSPTYDVSAILTSIQSLLDEPNPNSPANSLAAQLYQENRREYEKRVAAIVEQSWLNFNDDEGKESKKDGS
ncbi:hypothetical protein HPB48_009533 [Haemaphysalis longicornis]|uniref:E2 ubiquitin-conjugating enzyme n=2 Tax=Ixodidae TaxID=6939 RepID=A0A9J6GG42_HAELO|nr:hypothetical protein HPB48_009533 [Haemaphysalis longicornis]